MTQEVQPQREPQTSPQPEPDLATSTMRSVEVAQATLDKFLSAADVNKVYAEPVRQGDTTIIPCAEILSAMGFGIGHGFGRDSGTLAKGKSDGGSGDLEHAAGGGGGGGGGGGRVLSRPVAVITVSPSGVKVKPIVDVTKITLAGITAFGFILGTLFKMIRQRRRS